MATPDTARPAAAVTANGSRKTDRLGGAIFQTNKATRTELQAVTFSAIPLGTRWAALAISPDGERVRIGCFPHRKDALSAAAVMAGVCGARWCP